MNGDDEVKKLLTDIRDAQREHGVEYRRVTERLVELQERAVAQQEQLSRLYRRLVRVGGGLVAVLLAPFADAPPGAARDWMMPFGLSIGLWIALSMAVTFLAAAFVLSALPFSLTASGWLSTVPTPVYFWILLVAVQALMVAGYLLRLDGFGLTDWWHRARGGACRPGRREYGHAPFRRVIDRPVDAARSSRSPSRDVRATP